MSQESADMLQRDTLPMRVLNVLMDWIMDGKLKMGDKLNTEDLARQLGVSRMPIREALNSLVRMGLAESIPYVGMRLVTLNQDDILQIYMMRHMLEPMVAEEACHKVTEDDIRHLERIHQEYVEIVSRKEQQAKDRKRKIDLKKTEEEISRLEERNAAIDRELTSEEVYSNSVKCQELAGERSQNESRLEELYELWGSLAE